MHQAPFRAYFWCIVRRSRVAIEKIAFQRIRVIVAIDVLERVQEGEPYSSTAAMMLGHKLRDMAYTLLDAPAQILEVETSLVPVSEVSI